MYQPPTYHLFADALPNQMTNSDYFMCTCKAMDIRARDCMIELIRWYAGRELEKSSYAAGIVDNFLQSEYFKELQK